MRAALAFAVALGTAACAADDAAPPDTFLAFSSTFAPFRTWTRFQSDGPVDDGTLPADVLGPRTQYVDRLPPTGATEFPTGTVIVEVRESGAMEIFAGVKRGGGFNAGGARDWEWFELKENPVAIVWRGVGPPAGETYGGDPNGGCNSCHAQCGATNDYVCSPQLQLARF
jgi:hypothetical protein